MPLRQLRWSNPTLMCFFLVMEAVRPPVVYCSSSVMLLKNLMFFNSAFVWLNLASVLIPVVQVGQTIVWETIEACFFSTSVVLLVVLLCLFNG